MAVTGLVLQGGGALGAFELGIVECLLDHGIVPDVVSGVSIGAINAAVLCGARSDDPRESLAALWTDLTTPDLPFQPASVNQRVSLLGNPGMYRPRTDYFNMLSWLSFYDMAPLTATLEKHVRFEKLGPWNFDLPPNERAPRLILTATNVLTGKLERFDSAEIQITPAHVRASGSLPPSFPPTAALSAETRTEELHWDGGLFDNTPLSKVIDALQDSDDPQKTMYVVNLFPSAARLPTKIPEVVMRMVALAFSNKAQKDLRRARQTTKLILFLKELDALMEKHPELQQLARHPGYDALKEFSEPIDIVEFNNADVDGASDFSAAGISVRRRAGYDAAAQELATARPGGIGSASR